MALPMRHRNCSQKQISIYESNHVSVPGAWRLPTFCAREICESKAIAHIATLGITKGAAWGNHSADQVMPSSMVEGRNTVLWYSLAERLSANTNAPRLFWRSPSVSTSLVSEELSR